MVIGVCPAHHGGAFARFPHISGGYCQRPFVIVKKRWPSINDSFLGRGQLVRQSACIGYRHDVKTRWFVAKRENIKYRWRCSSDSRATAHPHGKFEEVATRRTCPGSRQCIYIPAEDLFWLCLLLACCGGKVKLSQFNLCAALTNYPIRVLSPSLTRANPKSHALTYIHIKINNCEVRTDAYT